MKKHEENRDIHSLAKIAISVDYQDKVITLRSKDEIGIRRWGKIDFLRKKGWDFVFDKKKKEDDDENKPLKLTMDDVRTVIRLRLYGNTRRIRIA